MGGLACLAHENRLCLCGLVQTERHIIGDCNLHCNIGVCYPGITFIVNILLHVVESINTPLKPPTTTSSIGSSSLCPSSAKFSEALDNTLSGGPPTGIPFHSLNSDIQQPISVPTPTHSASPPRVHVSCSQLANATFLVQKFCDPLDMNSYQSGLLGNARSFPRSALVDDYSTFVHQAAVTSSWATQCHDNKCRRFMMLKHHTCHILNNYTLMREPHS